MEMILLLLKKLFLEEIASQNRLILFLCLLPVMLYVIIKIIRNYMQRFNENKRHNMHVPTWPTAEGIVLESAKRKGIVPGEDGGEYTYFHILYKYVIDGKERYSDTFKLLEPMGDLEENCKKLVATYPVGTKVDVHYNPENPDQCCLQQADKKDISCANLTVFLMIAAIFAIGMTYAYLEVIFLAMLAILFWTYFFILCNAALRKRLLRYFPKLLIILPRLPF